MRTGDAQNASSEAKPRQWTATALCAGLAVLVWFVFGQTVHFAFLNYDDNWYVYDDPRVRAGISLGNIAWAFLHPVIGLWTPVTVISHMLDCQLFGISPWGHHLTNVLLHGAAVILLFVALWQMTQRTGRSAFVAAIFAIHPLRVESVAWIAERKDVLDGFFLALTLCAYAAYVKKPSRPRYTLMATFLALGLLAKPMLATVPVLLLLLDLWPLQRLQLPKRVAEGKWSAGNVTTLLNEKVPLFFLAGALVIVSMFGFRQPSALQTRAGGAVPIVTRLENGTLAAGAYLIQMVYPADAGVIHCVSSEEPSLAKVILWAAALAGISLLALAQVEARPWVAVGWFWYLIMLIPVSGLTSLGLEARADRYTYLPQIGLAIMLTWLVAEWVQHWPHRGLVLGSCASIIICLMACVARADAVYWRDSESLWRHTLERTSRNLLAEGNMADVLMSSGRVNEAKEHCLAALALEPDNPEVLENLGAACSQEGDLARAMAEFQKALAADPGRWSVHDNIGLVLAKTGHIDQALNEYRAALALNPADAMSWRYQGDAASAMGDLRIAAADYRQALAINPDLAEAHDSLGVTLLQLGKPREALPEFEEAVRLSPDDVNSLGDLAMLLATAPDSHLRNGAEALAVAFRAVALPGGSDAFTLAALAAAYAETGRFNDAIAAARRARAASTDPKFSQQLDSEISLYQAGRPYRDASIGQGSE